LAVGRHTYTTEVMAFDNTLETTTNARCRNFDEITRHKLLDSKYVADICNQATEFT
jgi:hypothetical protein